MASRHVATNFSEQIKECKKKIRKSFRRSHQALQTREDFLLSRADEIENHYKSRYKMNSVRANTPTDNEQLELTADADMSIEFKWDNQFETGIEQLGSLELLKGETYLNHDFTTVISQSGIKSDSVGKDRPLILKPTRGLKNLGNTCFMNCILQCLSHTLPLRDFFMTGEYKEHLKNKGDLSYAFEYTMSELWVPTSTVGWYPSHDLKRRVELFAPTFSRYDQHDAHEFMRFLLNELHEEINKADVKGRKSPGDDETLEEACGRYLTWENSQISELFSGMLRSEVCCSVCKHRSTVYDPFMDLALPIPKSKSTSSQSYHTRSVNHVYPTPLVIKLNDCMQVFTMEKTLDEEDRPYCNICNDITTSTKQLSILKFPKFLVIHLRRFSGYSVRSKVFTPVEFEERWEICDNSRKTHAYSLYGIACHSGGIYGGHYTAFCKYNKQWRYYNDGYTEATNWDDVKCQEAYILFYESIDNN